MKKYCDKIGPLINDPILLTLMLFFLVVILIGMRWASGHGNLRPIMVGGLDPVAVVVSVYGWFCSCVLSGLGGVGGEFGLELIFEPAL